MKHNSHLTAISRKTLPVPTRWLMKKGYVVNHLFLATLDYGCGKCHEVNNKHFPCDGYDPFFRPDGIKRKEYQIIICNYVLCTLPADERMEVLKKIQSLLTPTGVAYITVRNDRPKNGWGLSSRGTYQGRVRGMPLPLLYSNSQFRTYLMTKDVNL